MKRIHLLIVVFATIILVNVFVSRVQFEKFEIKKDNIMGSIIKFSKMRSSIKSFMH